MLQKEIIFLEQKCTVTCDQKCHKAWGLNKRPYIQLSDDIDDIVWLSDEELDIAPIHTGICEGGQPKPKEVRTAEDMNRWCVRECERSKLFDPGEELYARDYSKRVYNIKGREKDFQ